MCQWCEEFFEQFTIHNPRYINKSAVVHDMICYLLESEEEDEMIRAGCLLDIVYCMEEGFEPCCFLADGFTRERIEGLAVEELKKLPPTEENH